MWSTGQSWRVVNSLNKLNEQIRAYAPRAAPPATDANSWGSIADNVHSVSSDHYPHYYDALGSTAVVCARDFPHAPSLGLDGHVVTEHMRQARDPRVQYIICDRRITGVNYGWQWNTYTGSDPHDTHFHVSSVHTAIADSTATWSLPGGGGVAAATDKENNTMYLVRYKNPDGSLNSGLYGTNNEGTLVNFGVFGSDAVATYNTLKGSGVQEYTFFTEERAMTFAKMFEKSPVVLDPVAFAAALAPLLDNVDEQTLLSVLTSPAGQAALTSGAFAGAQQAESQ
jgi:hypothetical protein